MNNDYLITEQKDFFNQETYSIKLFEKSKPRELDWVEEILGRNHDSFEKNYEEALITYMSNLLAEKIDSDIINQLCGNWNQTNKESEM